MPNWLRNGLAALAGIMTGGGCVAGIEMIGHRFVSGTGVFMVAAAGLGVSAFIGGLVAIWIGRVSILVWIVAGVLTCLSLINVFSFVHPSWFVPVGAALLIAGAFAATRLMRSKGRTT